MEFTKNLARVSALALGIAGVLAYGDVHAAAFQLKENSVKAQGRAMAGAASAKGDASVVVNNPAVMSTFTERTLQADVTANAPEDKALLARFKLFGPPGIVFFDPSGHEVPGVRIVGFQSADEFLSSLAATRL